MVAAVPGTFYGAIKNWNPDKGWGFIECQQTHEVYGKDIFVMRSAMPANSNVNRGDAVSFTVQQGTKGPEAAGVAFISRGSAPGAAGVPGTAPLMMGPPMSGPSIRPRPSVMASQGAAVLAGIAAQRAASPGGAVGGVFVGAVKNWNPHKGWGFIQCEATEQMYGKDIFVMKSGVLSGDNLTPGQFVRFNLQTGLKGVEASGVVPAGHGHGVGHGVVHGVGHGARPPAAAPAGGQVYFGVIKSYHEEKGWGHINCPGTHRLFDKDMFMMRSSLNGQAVSQGSLVSFKVVMGMKGPEAAEVSVLPPGSFSYDNAEGGVAGHMFSGRIKNFNTEKGWGFIMGDEVRKVFDKDIFVHSRELAGHQPAAGEEVRFSVIINGDGRPEAATVSVGADPGADELEGFQADKPSTAGFVRYAPY